MIIIDMNGGLGNQMFQYALYLKFRSLKVRASMNTNHIYRDMEWLDRCTIFSAFNLDREYAPARRRTPGYFANKYLAVPLIKKSPFYYREKHTGEFDSRVLGRKWAYLEGYWQTERYFADIRGRLLEAFTLRQKLNQENRRMLQQIAGAEVSVAVHVRLGDYTSEANRRIYGGICTQAYYEAGVRHFQERYEGVRFFVFSNDSRSLPDFLRNDSCTVVDINSERTAWADMYLMSRCGNIITANSSFSWWAAWLNQNSRKKVIAPERWVNTAPMKDICPDSWLRI